MPCSNCNATEYAGWVDDIAANNDRINEINAEIEALIEERSELQAENNQLTIKKNMCDGQGGPP